MGLARDNPSGEVRLGLSATAASAVLYSAIVLFGVGSASPSALDVAGDPHGSAVLIQPHADNVSGSVQKLPQASPEPGRHRSRVRPDRHRTGVGSTPSPAPPSVEIAAPQPVPPRGPASASPGISNSTPALVAVPLPDVTVPTVPAPELPVPLPGLPVPLPLDLPG